MLVNYFKFKDISKRSKVIALSVVGGVFIFVSFLAIWQRNFTDSLVAYAPADANFYIHFSRPKINSSEKIDQILNKILLDIGLPNYDVLDIDREMAVIGHLDNDQVDYGVIFKTDRPVKVKKLLAGSNIKYKALTYNRFLVTNSNWLENYQIDKNNIVKSQIIGRFHALSSVNVYASSDFLNHSSDLNLGIIKLLLQNENSDLIVSFKAKGNELKLFYGGISSAVSAYPKFKSENTSQNIEGDLVFFTSDFYTLLNNWQDNLKGVSGSDYESFVASSLGTVLNTYLSADNRQISFTATRNSNNSGWLFADYDFYISIENAYPVKIEEILKIIMAYQYPAIKSVYLSDGTRVAELKPDIEQFSFVAKNGINYLYSPGEQFALMYRSTGNSTIISNSELLINQNWPNYSENINYLKFDTNLLPENNFTGYLKMFEILEIGKNGLSLK